MTEVRGNVIVGQSGGPTAVINSSLAGVFKTAKDRGARKVYGMLHGIQGLLQERYVDLEEHIKSDLDIELLKRTPSAYLGSCRFKLPEICDDREIYDKIFSILDKLEVEYFFYIGGNDSMDTIKKLSDVEQIEHFTGSGLYDREFIEILRRLDDPTPFLRGIVAELGYKRKEIPYEQPKRRAGKTHNNFYRLYDAAMLSVTSYTKEGLRLATIFGGVCAAVSMLIALVYLVMKLIWWDRFPAGMAPMLIGMLFLGSVQLFFIGFLGEYIMSINQRVMKRPLVIEAERLNFDEKPEEKEEGKKDEV